MIRKDFQKWHVTQTLNQEFDKQCCKWTPKQREQPMQGQVNRNCMPCARIKWSLTKAMIVNQGKTESARGRMRKGEVGATSKSPQSLWEAL